MSTHSEVEKCKEVIYRALNLKKAGNKQQYYAEFQRQEFMKDKTSSRNLRIWIKSFIDMLP